MGAEYNSIFKTYDEMKNTVQKKQIPITQEDLEFLKQLYNTKKNNPSRQGRVKHEILMQIFLDFLKHFKITKWRSYRIQDPDILKHWRQSRRRNMLFTLMPLKLGEYRNMVKLLAKSGKISFERCGNGKRVRYKWWIMEEN